MAAGLQDPKTQETLAVTRWVPIMGKWEIDEAEGVAKFTQPDDSSFKIGVALSRVRTVAGRFRALVQLSETEESCAHFVLGHSSDDLRAFTAGIGGFDHAFSVSEYLSLRRSKSLMRLGATENLKANHEYELEVVLRGQNLRLIVDGTEVLECTLPHPLLGDQFGIKGYGEGRVTFRDVQVTPAKPTAFIVMQFSEPYDSLWKEVVKPVSENAGYAAYRADDVYRPGVVLQDIVRGIVASDVIVAEVSPRNPNVFYELGFAHALGKPTILLAEQPKEGGPALPFDISGFRCIFYEDAIRGKSKVEEALKRHLENVKRGQDGGAGETE